MSQIQLKNGSCIDEKVDAVVNAANKYLAAGGGICGAIFSKADHTQLQNACNQYDTPLKDGEAVITPAFNLKNAKYIIHAVGPDFSVTPRAYNELAEAYYSSLKVLMQNNLHSISFPLISSGIFGGNLQNPAATSTEMCLKAYGWFLNNHPDYDIDVRLCAYSNNEYQDAQKVFANSKA
jgi:O-acetyl-ADP-ribose deacetylase (regulator of RNase III)